MSERQRNKLDHTNVETDVSVLKTEGPKPRRRVVHVSLGTASFCWTGCFIKGCFLFTCEQVSIFMLRLELRLYSSAEAPSLLSATLGSPSELRGGMREGKEAHVCPRPWKRAKVKYSSNALCCQTALLLVFSPRLEHTQQSQHTHTPAAHVCFLMNYNTNVTLTLSHFWNLSV